MTVKRTNIQFTGLVKLHVAGQEALPVFHQQLMQQAVVKGELPESLRFGCRIAQDVNTFFRKGLETVAGTRYVLNSHAPAQFGKDANGLPYLTVGIVNADDPTERYQLHWEGDGIPTKMKQVAVNHDQGKRVSAVTIALSLNKATVSEVVYDARRSNGTRNPETKRPNGYNHRKAARITPEDLR